MMNVEMAQPFIETDKPKVRKERHKPEGSEREKAVEQARERREKISLLFQQFFVREIVHAREQGNREAMEAWRLRQKAADRRAEARERLLSSPEKRIPTHEQLKSEGRLGEHGKNGSFFVRLQNGDTAIEKPLALESAPLRAVFDFGPSEGQMDRELIAEMWADLFLAHVPPTQEVWTQDGRASRQAWVELNQSDSLMWREVISPSDIEAGAAFDVALENLDRHDGNIGVDIRGQSVLYDNGLCCMEHLDVPTQRSVLLGKIMLKATRNVVRKTSSDVSDAASIVSRFPLSARSLWRDEAFTSKNKIQKEAWNFLETIPRQPLPEDQKNVLRAFLEASESLKELKAQIVREYEIRLGKERGAKSFSAAMANIQELVERGFPAYEDPLQP